MAHHGAVLLRKPGEVQRRAAAAVEMGGHAEQRADGDDAGAADAGDEDVIGRIEFAPFRQGKIGEQLARIDRRGLGSLQRAAMDGDETRTESLDAGIVLVAVRLVDLAFAAEFGFERLNRNAV